MRGPDLDPATARILVITGVFVVSLIGWGLKTKRDGWWMLYFGCAFEFACLVVLLRDGPLTPVMIGALIVGLVAFYVLALCGVRRQRRIDSEQGRP